MFDGFVFLALLKKIDGGPLTPVTPQRVVQNYREPESPSSGTDSAETEVQYSVL